MTTKNFFRQYWLAFVWMGLAVSSLGVLAALLLTRTPRGDFDPQIASLLMINFGAGLTRFFVSGGRLRELKFKFEKGWDFESKMTALILQTAAIAVGFIILWPFVEIVRQGLFLLRAGRAWRRGEILVTQEGRELHAG